MTSGINSHKEWYPGLTRWSTFEDFQQMIHDHELDSLSKVLDSEQDAKLICHKPCRCHTAEVGEHCYQSVQWAMAGGISTHPDWYKGLTRASRFEDFQALLHKEDEGHCPLPCRAPVWGSPSLFCFSISRATGYEPGLMKAHLVRGAGIFSCDEFTVLANKQFQLGKGPRGIVETIVFPAASVGISKDKTAANTKLFIGAWEKVRQATHYVAHDWTVKVDPDAVLIPERLRRHLSVHNGKSCYIRNCDAYPESADFPMMYGSLEAVSRRGIEAYFAQASRCESGLPWGGWGEDFFLGKCLKMLGVAPADDFSIISDGVCSKANCEDRSAAAFHPFKSEDSWLLCWRTAMGDMRDAETV